MPARNTINYKFITFIVQVSYKLHSCKRLLNNAYETYYFIKSKYLNTTFETEMCQSQLSEHDELEQTGNIYDRLSNKRIYNRKLLCP